ncbi:MAG: Fic family protein, partial [Alistipes sp.]|nr:Fic family protein [Alistipes sp.]
TGRIIPNRSGDSHDILGTFNVVSNKTEMQRTPATEDEFLTLLQRRHAAILQGRPDMDPGGFKTKGNRAGDTFFVAPERVEGTLRHGFKFYRALTSPLAKAIYMMFLCSEVHPFNDGNGRVSRIMMNAELVAAGQTRIIVPTVFRDDYILALRKLTRSSVPAVYIKAMSKLQDFCSRIDASTFGGIHELLTQSNAVKEPDEARLLF